MIHTVESERLVMTQFTQDHFDDFAAFLADPVQAKYIGGHCDRPDAWRRFASILGHWQLRGFGFWAVEEKTSGDFAGCVGLWMPEGWPELEVGYWITTQKQGKGYATEAGLRAKKAAYEDLGHQTLVSYIHPDNQASKNVAIRMGAFHEKTIELSKFGPHCVFRHSPK